MAMAVLSPQDCLNPHHERIHTQVFNSFPDSLLSPVHFMSIPDVTSKLSRRTLHHSTGDVSPVVDAHTGPPIWPFRSSSTGAILRSAHLSSPTVAERACSSTGRRTMQENVRLENHPDMLLQDKPQHYSKFSDSTLLPRKNVLFNDRFKGSDCIGDIKKRSHGDLIAKDSGFMRSRSEADQKDADKRLFVNQVDPLCKQDIGFRPSPPVTILQRPKTQEKWMGQKSFSPAARMKKLARSRSDDVTSFIQPVKLEAECLASVASNVKALSPEKGAEIHRRKLVNGVESLKHGELLFSEETEVDTTRNACLCMPSLVPGERWAGPAFTTSPPPSSLPLPKFSLRGLRSCSLELHLSEKKGKPSQISDSVLISPGKELASCYSNFQRQEGSFNVAFATKDLRRILHLDSY